MLREYNIVVKRRVKGLVRIALLYPSTYEVSISSLAYQMIYYALNSYPEVAAERVVLSEGSRSLETGLSLRLFDLILVFLHYENSIADTVGMLWSAGINPLRKRREGKPVIIAGGPPVTANPKPYAGLFDAMVIGEAEPVLRRIIEAWLRCSDKKCFLEDLAGSRGIYVPEYSSKRIVKSYVPMLDEAFHPVRQIQPLDREPVWGRGYMLESGRGCGRGCRFCMEGHIFLPRRERSLRVITRLAEKGAAANNASKIIFYDLAFLDHRDSTRILEELVEDMGLKISVPSLRVDALTPRHLELIARGGQRTLTVAPETPHECLGRALNKLISRDMVEGKMREAVNAGIKMFKLYYMVGLPLEPRNIAELIAKDIMYFREKLGSIVLKVSVNPFIPKPHTPLQWAPMASLQELRAKLRELRRTLAGSIEYSEYDPRWARIQAAISRGDERLSPILARWGVLGGGLGAWRKTLREAGVGEDDLLKPPEPEAPTPWSIVDLLVPEEALRRGYEQYTAHLSACKR